MPTSIPPRDDSSPGPARSLLARVAGLGPASLLLVLAAGLLLVFSLFRAAFVVLYLHRLRALPGFLELLPLGLRFDLMTAAFALAPPALALLLLPAGALRRVRWAFAAYSAVLMALALFFELASVGFLDPLDPAEARAWWRRTLADRKSVV